MSILPPSDPLNSRLYLEWVRQFDPGVIDSAEELVETLVAGFRKARKPGAFVDEISWRARELPEGHRPWFWDMVGHWMSASAGHSQWDTRYRTAAISVYGLARAAEREHSLPVHVDYHRENTLLFARAGTLPVKEVAVHQRWLATVGSAAEAHHEFVRLLMALAQGGAALGADLHRRVRASAKAAELGIEEDARVLADVLGVCTSAKVPDGLLDGAARVFAQCPVDDVAPLLNLFPATATDGAALIRLLDAAGAIDRMADGTVLPPAGLAGWISRFFGMYCYVQVSYGGVTKQPMPPELFDLIERIGPRLKESGERVSLSWGRYRHVHIDADVADALLAAGVGVDVSDGEKLHFWGAESQRDLIALAADPVLGPRLESTVHADRETTSTAIVRLPHNPGIERSVRARIVALIDRVANGGLLDAELALTELDDLLDLPTVQALDGIEEALAALDGTGPLLRTLRAGIPAEFHWPAWEQAFATLGRVHGMTATWPMLTLYGQDRAVVIDPHGIVAETSFTLPCETESHVVFYAGGDFLIGYSATKRYAEQAFWASAPGEVFSPAESYRMASCHHKYDGGLGYQFATPDGRHDGQRILRPGDRIGVADTVFQLSDGERIWSLEGYRSGLQYWAEIDPTTGTRAELGSPPAFFTEYDVPADKELVNQLLSYARLPEGVTSSPLGAAAGMTGYRVLRDRGGWTGYVLEGTDGRRATYAGGRGAPDPIAIVRFPEGEADLLLDYGSTYSTSGIAPMRVHDGSSPLWEVRADPGSVASYPPPAFWHFLTPRDTEGSRALRTLDDAAVRAFLTDAVLPPGITDPTLADDVRGQVDRAARLAQARERLSQRVATMRSGNLITPPAAAPDSDLLPALLGLLDQPRDAQPSVLPATITAIAADGRFLAGAIDETLRRMSPPAPPIDWTPLLGHIDAVAWRAINGRTPDDHRTALVALLRTWAAQPFAQPGEWRLGSSDTVTIARDDATRIERILDLLAHNGPRIPGEKAVQLFAERTGMREPIARLVLDGLPRRCHFGGGYAHLYDEHQKMLRTKPYRATREVADLHERLTANLGWSGRRRILAAGIPDDPAELWTEAGELAAAERMAEVWNDIIGPRLHVPEDLTAELEATTSLHPNYALALAHPGASPIAKTDTRCELRLYRDSWLQVFQVGSHRQNFGRWNPYRDLATALAWALTERPVGDPASTGIAELYERLHERLQAPKLLVTLSRTRVTPEHFGPNTHDDAPYDRIVYDDGLVIVDGHDWQRSIFLRPAALTDQEKLSASLRTCTDHGYTEVAHDIRCEETLLTGLARMVERAATTPVAPGHYEANPRQSVPELVQQVSAATGTTSDAAALYLQLLTLARPTDRNVRRWNGWTPAVHKKAQKELTSLGLAVEDKRPRAGRTAFIPGPWTENLPKPHLPMETAKLPTHLVRIDDKEIIAPFTTIHPPIPLHEMFTTAWESKSVRLA
ncbi:hypothetical protein [Nocardia sp. CDC160]|uniref:hypothetical protein n=1 Tax=Nocardia sp. CDC160 TaxID=3112166 RepID=UPI002DBC68CF|nr:hypothetical protein [Nocardia sp. CDC160]MEC3920039.1 hypothetical protein [Nocardia sp. CDC160]